MKHLFFGIKGTGMSTLAQILYDLGEEIVGYDDYKEYKFTEDGLKERGIKIYHDDSLKLTSDMVVTYSGAFDLNHKELLRAKEFGLPVKKYNELIGDLSRLFKTICVSGTHGKTTTSLMLSNVLESTIGTNYFVGDGTGYANKNNEYFVLESCEYKKNFLSYQPYYTIITNIELEHTECYKDIEDIINTFQIFANKSTKGIIACGDDLNIRKIKTNKDIFYYGFNDDNDVIAKNLILNEEGSSFDVFYKGKLLGHFFIPLFGKHMVLNALAVVTLSHLLNIDIKSVEEELQVFKGAKRRFSEIIINEHIVIDDYAHHPTEIKVTIESVRQKYPEKRVVVVFLPNTYSRTYALFNDFIEALNKADKSYVMDIYSDREKKGDYPNISSDMIINKLNNGDNINIDTVDKLLKEENAVICFMSCGSIYKIRDKYLELLK